MTAAATAAPQTVQQAMIYTFTLTFQHDEIAILEVRGAANLDSARAAARSALPQCPYTVEDGDQTGGRAEYFYLWCSAAAQEQQPHPGRQAERSERTATAR